MQDPKLSTASVSAAFEQATGSIDYRFTNDYMFRAFLQKSEYVLRALICSLLHLKPDDIRSVRITNPIELGEAMEDKEYILDITILMNDNTFLNLEMQVKPELYWCERSLSYLCRSFDQLYRGDDYATIGPAIHIGFLDHTPFKDAPEFYATYKLLNVKNHRLYSDKFILSVVDLTQTDLATDEDKTYQIDRWARLFKATTWEELKMIAKNDTAFLEASKTLYSLNADETIRAKCRAREDYERLQNTKNNIMNKLTEENRSLTAEKKKLTTENESLTVEKQKLSSENEELKKLLEEHGISYPKSDD